MGVRGSTAWGMGSGVFVGSLCAILCVREREAGRTPPPPLLRRAPRLLGELGADASVASGDAPPATPPASTRLLLLLRAVCASGLPPPPSPASAAIAAASAAAGGPFISALAANATNFS